MKVILHNALGEINDILKFTNNEREKTDILELLLSLIKDTQGTLESSKIKKIKAVKAPAPVPIVPPAAPKA